MIHDALQDVSYRWFKLIGKSNEKKKKTCAKVILIVSNSRYSGESWACAEAGTKPASNLQDYLEEVLALRPLILVKFRQVYTHQKG